MRFIYVAGPYRHVDPVENTHVAVQAGNRLADLGFIPFIPHSATMSWHLICPRPVEFWLDWDMEWMRKCDAVVRLPGYSPGSDAEVAEADRLGIPVYYSIDALLAANLQELHR